MVRLGRTECGGDVDDILGGGMDRGRGGSRDILIRLEDNVEQVTLGTEPNAPLAYALCSSVESSVSDSCRKGSTDEYLVIK